MPSTSLLCPTQFSRDPHNPRAHAGQQGRGRTLLPAWLLLQSRNELPQRPDLFCYRSELSYNVSEFSRA